MEFTICIIFWSSPKNSISAVLRNKMEPSDTIAHS